MLDVDGLGEAGQDGHLHPLHRVQPEQMAPPLLLHQGGGGMGGGQVRPAGEIWADGVWQELQSGDVGRDKAQRSCTPGRDSLVSCHHVAVEVIQQPCGAINGKQL